jgi:hypothetical protein
MKTGKLSFPFRHTLLAAGTFTGCRKHRAAARMSAAMFTMGWGSMTHGITAITIMTMM